MDEDETRRLQDLGAQIDAARKAREPEPRRPGRFAGAELGWRLTIDLVVGIGIGFAIGYGLDGFFGTVPLFLIVFTLLGFAAGVKVMLRSAREAQDRAARGEPGPDETGRDP